MTLNVQQLENCSTNTDACSSSEPIATQASNRPVLVPRADIYEDNGDIVVVADLPGVDESCVDITIEKNILTIKATSQWEVPQGLALSYAEFKHGDYQRRFALPNEIDRDGINASMKNGVLKLVLPKSTSEKVRKIEVKTSTP